MNLLSENKFGEPLASLYCLNLTAGGPGVRLPLSSEVASLQYKGQWQASQAPGEHQRRSIYVFVKRNLHTPLFECFDAPSTMVSCGSRTQSIHAGQALAMMNGQFIDQQSWLFARRLIGVSSNDRARAVQLSYRLALARPPLAEEQQVALDFLDQHTELLKQQASVGVPPEIPVDLPGDVDPHFGAALADSCLALFNLDEFLFVD